MKEEANRPPNDGASTNAPLPQEMAPAVVRLQASVVPKLNLGFFQNAVPALLRAGTHTGVGGAARRAGAGRRAGQAHRASARVLEDRQPDPGARGVEEICEQELASLARWVVASGKAGEEALIAMARELGQLGVRMPLPESPQWGSRDTRVRGLSNEQNGREPMVLMP